MEDPAESMREVEARTKHMDSLIDHLRDAVSNLRTFDDNIGGTTAEELNTRNSLQHAIVQSLEALKDAGMVAYFRSNALLDPVSPISA